MNKVIKVTNFINKYMWYPIVDGFTSVYEKTKYVVAYTSIVVLLVSIGIKIFKNIGF